MRDPFLWSIPLGRLFGITLRVHVLYPVLVIVLVLRVVYHPKDVVYADKAWLEVLILAGLLLFSVILHEFGHCFAARRQQGEANEILIWPLGGLANVDVPHTPWAHFFTAAAGPAVNLGLCLVCAVLLGLTVDPAFQPPWNPVTWIAFRDRDTGGVLLSSWGGTSENVLAAWPVFLARLFYVNWILFLLNVLLMGYPLDGGRMLQSALWPHLGYRQSMLVSIFAGFVAMFIVGIIAIVYNNFIWLSLAIVIYFACKYQWIVLETGGEEGLFGYDFSQGYTSLERDQPAARPARKVGWWKGWLQRRAARKLQRETEQREAEERRLDELLEKIERLGIRALTDEEQRFMKRVSDRYRNRP
jgi:Zn-dependent protease